MSYPNDLREQVLNSADIVSVISSCIEVKKKGKGYWAICPFHNDSSPSLSIHPEKKIFRCFSCGHAGNAITFIRDFKNISYDEALKQVAELSGIHDPRLYERKDNYVVRSPEKKAFYDCISDLAKYYVYCLSSEEGKEGKEYLKSRNISDEQIQKYGIGYAPKDGANTIKYLLAKGHSLKSIESIGINLNFDGNAGRVMFPLKDPSGVIVGFSGRKLDSMKNDVAKYVNTGETSIFTKGNNLFNYSNLHSFNRDDNKGYLYVLEGYMDVLALDRAGIPAVALMGVSISDKQLKLLKSTRREIRLCLDNDLPGQEGEMKAIPRLQNAGISFRIVSRNSEEGKDPDEILQHDGIEGLKKVLNQLIDPFDFQMSYYLNIRHLETNEDKVKVINHFLPYIQALPAGIVRDNCLVKLSKATSYDIDALYRHLKNNQNETSGLERNTLRRDRSSYQAPSGKFRQFDAKEKALLHYMLSDEKALQFFNQEIEHFVIQDYETIANYLYDSYSRLHKIDIPSLLDDLDQSNEENKEVLKNLVVRISESEEPPINDKLLCSIRDGLAKIKNDVGNSIMTEEAMQGKPTEDKIRLIQDYADNRKLAEK